MAPWLALDFPYGELRTAEDVHCGAAPPRGRRRSRSSSDSEFPERAGPSDSGLRSHGEPPVAAARHPLLMR